MSRAGSSTNTTSPKLDCACSVIVIVPKPVVSSKDTVSCSAVNFFAMVPRYIVGQHRLVVNVCMNALMSVRNCGLKLVSGAAALRGRATRAREACLAMLSMSLRCVCCKDKIQF